MAGEQSITADTALRLARYFGTSPRYWLSLQTYYDLEVAEEISGGSMERKVRPCVRLDAPAQPSENASK